MASSKVEICGVETSTLPVLTNERMCELFPLVHGGDRAAREEFIRGNLRLVLSVVQRFSNRGENGGNVTFFSEESNKEPVLETKKLLE